MALIEDKDRGPLCPRCKRIVVELVSLTDDNKGKRVCIRCKREIKKKDPNRDYRKFNGFVGDVQ